MMGFGVRSIDSKNQVPAQDQETAAGTDVGAPLPCEARRHGIH